jgi:hypothetical protein
LDSKTLPTKKILFSRYDMSKLSKNEESKVKNLYAEEDKKRQIEEQKLAEEAERKRLEEELYEKRVSAAKKCEDEDSGIMRRVVPYDPEEEAKTKTKDKKPSKVKNIFGF